MVNNYDLSTFPCFNDLFVNEHPFRQIADVSFGRNRKDAHYLKKTIDELCTKNEVLDEEVAARETINQLLDDEHETDVTTLMKWTSEVDTFEEDIFTLLKFRHQDSINVKEHHLKLERCREKVGQCKKVCTLCPVQFGFFMKLLITLDGKIFQIFSEN